MTRDRGKLYAYLAFVGVFAALNYASRLVPNKPEAPRRDGRAFTAKVVEPVSYTHLTLPTIYSV